MRKKKRAVIIDRCGDDDGDLLRLGRVGSKYFIERITPAFEPDAGRVTRTFQKTKREAERKFEDGCAYLGIF